jgi:glutamate--cysteine ligase catalytic subunit
VAINLPVYIDKSTPRPFVDPTIPWHRDVFPEDAGALLGYMASVCESLAAS